MSIIFIVIVVAIGVGLVLTSKDENYYGKDPYDSNKYEDDNR